MFVIVLAYLPIIDYNLYDRDSGQYFTMAKIIRPKVKLTKRIVDAAQVPAPDKVDGKIRSYFIWDDELTGFGLKVSPVGRKTYVYQYRVAVPGQSASTPARRFTIGKHGPITAELARKEASRLALMVSQKIDPMDAQRESLKAKADAKEAKKIHERNASELAFDIYADTWLNAYETEKSPPRRPSSVRQAKLVVNRYLKPALKDKPMPSITADDLEAIIDGIDASHIAMRRTVFAYSSVLFKWALKKRKIAENPLEKITKPDAPESRDRVLSPDELRLVWNASFKFDTLFGPFFRLLILAGQRRSEVAGIAWPELDRGEKRWTIPADRAKNKKPHIVHLSAAAIHELDRLAGGDEWPKKGLILTTNKKNPISGISKAKRQIDLEIAKANDGKTIPHWRIHDLRRTVATGLQKLGIRFEVTEAVLNHISGSKSGVAGIYQQHDWIDEKRDALDQWAMRVNEICSDKEGKLIAFPSTKIPA